MLSLRVQILGQDEAKAVSFEVPASGSFKKLGRAAQYYENGFHEVEMASCIQHYIVNGQSFGKGDKLEGNVNANDLVWLQVKDAHAVMADAAAQENAALAARGQAAAQADADAEEEAEKAEETTD